MLGRLTHPVLTDTHLKHYLTNEITLKQGDSITSKQVIYFKKDIKF